MSKNIAIVFAGGTGQRMNSRTKPKQFLELRGKPILVYTLEKFQNCDEIDGIILSVLSNWESYCRELVARYQLTKVVAIVPGGEDTQASVNNGLSEAIRRYDEDSIVLIHDGVRPLVDRITILDAIECVRANGSAITVVPVTETIVIKGLNNTIGKISPREDCRFARAPQCFYLGDIWAAHKQAEIDGTSGFLDSASLMQHYGHTLHTINGSVENIKITTPLDFYLFRAIMDARENSQIYGL